MDFSRIDQLKATMDQLRPLSKDEVDRLREEERVDQVYNSNALEGNTITKFETKMILEEGITISEKPMREHLEVVNLAEAVDFVESLVNENQPLTENLIKDIHKIVYSKLAKDRRNVGSYRRIPVEISGSNFVPPDPFLVPLQMEQLIQWSRESRDQLHPVEYAAMLHEKFVTIHPFIDGNGRTARLLMNFALTEAGYPPIVVKANPNSRLAYNRSLEIAQTQGDLSQFIQFVSKIVEEKLEKMVHILEMAHDLDNRPSMKERINTARLEAEEKNQKAEPKPTRNRDLTKE